MADRRHCNADQMEAHRVLDLARAGGDVSPAAINWALWATGDAVGITNMESKMKFIHINEARCKGTDGKPVPTTCPERNGCVRHKQITLDRQLGISHLNQIRTYQLPRVAGNSCPYLIKED